LSLAFSYWIDNLGFITEEKLTAIFIKPSLGVSNWPVIYIINYTPTVLWHYSTPRHQRGPGQAVLGGGVAASSTASSPPFAYIKSLT
jgi:hypothetical protein